MPSLQPRLRLCTPIVVKIGAVPISDALRALYTSLEQSGGTHLLSVQITSVDARVQALEGIAIRAVIKLLGTDLHRVQDLVVNAHWRSSLEEVTRLVHPGSQGLEMFYNVDDVSV